MPDAIITSTESTFGTISGTFAADQSTITGTVTGIVAGTLDGTVGVPGPGVPLGGTEGQIIVKQSSTDYDTAWADNSAETLTATVRNETGATLTKGTVVYITGAAGNKALVSKASASSEATSSKTFAILSADILNNQNGTAVTVGLLKGLDTSALTEGGSLWLSTTAGQWTQTMPTAPNHAVFLGTVTRVHANQGTVEVRIQNGYELQELHNVKITSVSNGQVLKYDSAQSLWVNGTDVGVPAGGTAGQFLQKIDGTDYNTDWVTVNLSAYAVKANNLSDLTSFSDARDNLNLGTLNTPVFAGVTAQGSGSNVANLTPTSLSLTHTTAGTFTIQPSVGITFPDSTVQTTAFTTALLSGYATESWVTAGFYPLTGNPSGFLTSASLTGYATESWVTSQGYITSAALSPYLLSSTAASTYQTIAGMSSYLTTSAAASTYAPIASPTFTGLSTFNNPGNYAITIDNTTGYYTSISSGVYSIFNASTEVIRLSSAGVKYPDGVTQSVAYPGPSGFLLKADNLSGLANTATARTNLGLGTMATETASNYLTTSAAASTYLTQSSAASTYYLQTNPAGYITSSALSPYLTTATAASTYAPLASPALTGTPTAPTATAGTNTTQIATTAFVTAAVPTFATFTTPTPTSTTTIVNPKVAMDYIMHPGRVDMYGGGYGSTSGTGASTNVSAGTFRVHEMIGPNTGVAGTAGYFFDETYNSYGMYAFTRGAGMIQRAWNKAIWASGRCVIGAATVNTYNGDANSTIRISVGGKSSTAGGDLSAANPGFGWKIPGMGNAMQLQVSNGSAVTTVTSSFTPVARQVFDWKTYSDGAGNVTLWINDSQVATTTGGPNTATPEDYNYYFEQVEQTSAAATRVVLYSLNPRVWWGV